MAFSSSIVTVLGVMTLASSNTLVLGSKKTRVADAVGSYSSCTPASSNSNPLLYVSCTDPKSTCVLFDNGYSGPTYICQCRSGFEPNDEASKCVYEASFPLNSTECTDETDCTRTGSVCRANRIIPSAVPGGARPAVSSTGKRCQCDDAKDFDPKTLTCATPLISTDGCYERGGTNYCKARNPDYICLPKTATPNPNACSCPPPATVDPQTLACSNPALKVCKAPADCGINFFPMDVNSNTATCDTKTGRCVCTTKLAQPAVPDIPGGAITTATIPADTPGTLVYNRASSTYKCAAVVAQSPCTENATCATTLAVPHFCWRSSLAATSGYCMCPSLTRPGVDGLLCNPAFGRCCNPALPANSYQCGLPLVAPGPGVLNLSCLSGICACPSGTAYQAGRGCVAAASNNGATCNIRS